MQKVADAKEAGIPIAPGVAETLRIAEQSALFQLGWPQTAAWKETEVAREPAKPVFERKIEMMEEARANIKALHIQERDISKLLKYMLMPGIDALMHLRTGHVVQALTAKTDEPTPGRFTPAEAERLSKLSFAEAQREVVNFIHAERRRLKELREGEQFKFEQLKTRSSSASSEQDEALLELRGLIPE
jgi:hypothetical protein